MLSRYSDGAGGQPSADTNCYAVRSDIRSANRLAVRLAVRSGVLLK